MSFVNRKFVNNLLHKSSNWGNWFDSAWLLVCTTLVYACLLIVNVQAAPYETVSSTEQPFKVGIIVSNSTNKSNFINFERSCVVRGMARSYYLYNSDDQIRFIFQEVDSNYAIASAKAAQALVEQGVQVALIHLTSNQAESAADVLSISGIPYVTSATSLSVIKPGYKGISISSSNKTAAAFTARYALEHYSSRPFFIIPNLLSNYSNEYTELFKREVKKINPQKHITVLPLGLENERLEDMLQRVPNGSFVFAPMYSNKVGILYDKIVHLNKKDIIFFAGNSQLHRGEFKAIIGSVSDDVKVLFLSQWDFDRSSIRNSLEQRRKLSSIQRIVDTYCDSETIPSHVTVAYDLMKVLMAVSSDYTAETTPTELMDLIIKSPYNTLTTGNSFEFDDDGFADKPMYLFELKNDQIMHLETMEPTNQVVEYNEIH